MEDIADNAIAERKRELYEETILNPVDCSKKNPESFCSVGSIKLRTLGGYRIVIIVVVTHLETGTCINTVESN